MRAVVLGIALAFVASAAPAASPPVPAALKCEFETHTSGMSDEGQSHFVAEAHKDGGLDALTYAAIDPEHGTAQLIGNLGASKVSVIVTGITWSFIEVTAFGNVNVTQAFIYDEPDASKGVYRAVHSRQSSILGAIVASQHFGHCTAFYQ